MDDKDYIKSLEKAVNLICFLSQHGSPLKLEDLVKISGVKKTSCFRILQTLTKVGFVAKDQETSGYCIGPKMISIGLSASKNSSIRELALPFMKELREKTGITVNLAILSGPEVVFVERLPSAHIMEANLQVGSRLSVHYSSMGKVMLAYLPEAQLENILEQIHFEKKTGKTIASIRTLEEELRGIRQRGFAVNDEELEAGLFAIAAPLRNQAGVAVAAMNISFPLIRHSRQEALKTFCPLLLEACRNISSLLGFAG
ncbi:MAG: IclR family transcriptional regulator [Deltaproteobacteria bacterium]|nr:IclR family transcriptional regulator [Deltaproteobacteria bacterium]